MQPPERSTTHNRRATGPSEDVVTRPRFDAGLACLNLLATVGRRGGDPVERLPATADFASWLVTAGLLDTAPPVGEQDLDGMRALRESAYRVVEAARAEHVPDAGDVRVLNFWAAHPTPSPQLAVDRTATWVSAEPVHAALAVLARQTIELVSDSDVWLVRACAAPECRMLFLDSSRGARRRWCSMARCGNRAKARGHAARRRASG